MKDYKRLTKRSDFGWFHRNCENCPSNGKCNPKGSNFFDCLSIFVDRLGELEDLIESNNVVVIPKGRCSGKAFARAKAIEKLAEQSGFVKLPCKVGDTVYQFDNGGKIYESKIKNIIYDTAGFAFDETAIGETIFLTKEEAETKIKELRGEK